jgi:hypothetical protein
MADAKQTTEAWRVEMGYIGSDLKPFVVIPGEDGLLIRDADRARLIAAAPKLLAALKRCELAMDTAAMHGVGDILPPAYRDSWAEAHTAARALITQVEGGGS